MKQANVRVLCVQIFEVHHLSKSWRLRLHLAISLRRCLNIYRLLRFYLMDFFQWYRYNQPSRAFASSGVIDRSSEEHPTQCWRLCAYTYFIEGTHWRFYLQVFYLLHF